jgi:dienelactone hydrolase
MKYIFKYGFVSLLACMCFALAANAQKQFNVLDWKTDVTLNTYLVQQMHAQYEARRKEFEAAIKSKEAATVYVKKVQAKAKKLFGNLPAKTALHATVSGTIRKEGYSIEKIAYESFPGHHVTANLYLPVGQGPFPAALFFCGHEDISKATESYQKTAILFAKSGFAVLVIDPISQAERYQLTDANGKPLTRGGTTEHTLLNETSNLGGTSTPADELWDNVRALDYLFTRKEIDTSRVGCLGNSGGGIQTIYFAAIEKRIKVMAVCSFLFTRERALELTGPSDGCSQMPDEGKLQMEMNDFLIAAAPTPVLVLAGRYDFIDYTGTVTATNELKKFYSALGKNERVELFTVDDGHGISKPKREAALSWFQRWLKNDLSRIREGDLLISQPSDLTVTASGQVSTSFSNEVSIPARNLALYDAAASSRQQFAAMDRNVQLQAIKKMLRFEKPSASLHADQAGFVEKDGLTYNKIILRREREVPLPVLVIYPSGAVNSVILWCDGRGKNKIADSTEYIQSMLNKNAAIVLADLRGMGETEDRTDQNDPKYYNREYRNAMLALHIGKPLAAQRTTDIQTVLDLIGTDDRLKGHPVQLYASGFATHPAMFAALFNPQIATLEVSDLPSYKYILDHPVERDWYSYVIPNVLLSFDVPDIVKILSDERRLVVRTSKKL